MHDLVNKYYLFHFSQLTRDKQFHYATRLWLWSKEIEPEIEAYITSMRATYCGATPAETRSILHEVASNPSQSFGAKHAAEARQEYFSKYPLLRKANALFFKMLYMETIYSNDVRYQMSEILDIGAIEKLYVDLMNDPKAISVLSTHAINFLYLYKRFFKRDTGYDLASELYNIWKNMQFTNNEELLLGIYFITHMIIGETIFYARKLPESFLPTYQNMLRELSLLVEQRIADITLDCKFELIVCNILAGIENSIQDEVMKEAEQSISPDGNFIIDRHNAGLKTNNISFDDSEHRNVLFVMTGRATKLAPIQS